MNNEWLDNLKLKLKRESKRVQYCKNIRFMYSQNPEKYNLRYVKPYSVECRYYDLVLEYKTTYGYPTLCTVCCRVTSSNGYALLED